jgi:hypothetical protein
MVDFGRGLELINSQQAGKKEVKKVLTQEALVKALQAVDMAKKKGKKQVTSKELEIILKK